MGTMVLVRTMVIEIRLHEGQIGARLADWKKFLVVGRSSLRHRDSDGVQVAESCLLQIHVAWLVRLAECLLTMLKCLG